MKYAKIVLCGGFCISGSQTKSLTTKPEKRFRFDHFLLRVEKIIADKKIGRVLIECKNDFYFRLYSGAEELREQFERLRKAGKEVVFYSSSYETLQLFISSACSRRILHPLGTLSFLGLSRSFLFFKGAMEKYGFTAEVIRRGRYKSAADPFRTDRLDRENEEQYKRFFESVMEELRLSTAEGLGKSAEEMQRLLDGEILDAESARSEGWIHEVETLKSIEERWKKEEKVKRKKLKRLGRSYGKGRSKIAVLMFEGAIVDGKTKKHPLFGQAIGADSFVPHIEKLIKEKRVKGVVLLVNSGGGSATASEDILDPLKRLKEKKPLVVSMSDVAGSGGYWIACAAERLFVRKTSLTGSIGVIMMFLGIRNFLRRYGVTEDSIRTAPHADLGSPYRSVTEKERKMVDGVIEGIYEKFIHRVASFRDMEKGEIQNLAGGRVWSGSDAVTRGLADELGGLEKAVEYLKSKLELEKTRVVFYPEIKKSFIEKKLSKAAGGARLSELDASITPSKLEAGLGLFGFDLTGLEQGRGETISHKPLVLMPEYITMQLVRE
ncbi:MAG: signal peptide peptidase SppA [Spirochaetaceae bacterium]